MRVFVCEYITGGGLYGAPLPASLLREGEMMVRALLHDLLALDGVEVCVSRDPRLGPLGLPVNTVRPMGGQDIWAFWRRCMEGMDALWPIAPESGGVLERLSALAVEGGRLLLGSRPEAVRTAASKWASAQALAMHALPVVPTLRRGDPLPESPAGWVVKPDDGVGCEDARFLRDCHALARYLNEGRRDGYVIQPYVPGTPASLSLLCRGGEARLLACNRQLVALEEGCFRYRGSLGHAVQGERPALEGIARGVARALPGLWGYVGVDVVLGTDGPVVMEVNPRLTTSYAGLGAALGCNPAALVLGLLEPAHWPALAQSDRVVAVEVEQAHVS